MITSIRPTPYRSALIALGCSLILSLSALPVARAAEARTIQPMADKAPSLPLTATFAKAAGAGAGPQYVLNLKNTSKNAVTVSAKITLSVVYHSSAKTRELPAHVIDPGQVWTIPELASLDKVSITAEGFAPLELTVP